MVDEGGGLGNTSVHLGDEAADGCYVCGVVGWILKRDLHALLLEAEQQSGSAESLAVLSEQKLPDQAAPLLWCGVGVRVVERASNCGVFAFEKEDEIVEEELIEFVINSCFIPLGGVVGMFFHFGKDAAIAGQSDCGGDLYAPLWPVGGLPGKNQMLSSDDQGVHCVVCCLCALGRGRRF